MINPFLDPAGYIIGKGINAALSRMQNVAKDGTIEELEIEARKQEIQAKVAQELAIAERISNAETVEIEEFYDLSGEGNIGLNIKEGTANLGASGGGRKVTSRVYRFKGFALQNELIKENESKDKLEGYNVDFVFDENK